MVFTVCCCAHSPTTDLARLHPTLAVWKRCSRHHVRRERSKSLTGKWFRLVGGDGTQVLQVVLVADKHDDNVGIGMVMQLSQPTLDILKRQVLGNIIHHESADSTTVVTATSAANITNSMHYSQSAMLSKIMTNVIISETSPSFYFLRHKFHT